MRTTGEHEPAKVELGSFLGNLPELLTGLLADGRCLALIVDFDDGRYVQVLIDERSILAEVISNLHAPEEGALTSDQEEALDGAGWLHPEPNGNPNWHREFTGLGEVFLAADTLGEACRRILGKGEGPRPEMVSLRTFEMNGASRVRDRSA